MDVMKFTQAVSRIWVLETRLLDKAKVERMIEGYVEEAFDTFYIMDVPITFGKRKEYRDRQISIIRKSYG